MNKIKLVAFDMDGTALDNNSLFTERNRKVMQRLIDRGVYMIPATGRPLKNLMEEVVPLKNVPFAITSNGARLTELATGQALYRSNMAAEEAARVVETLLLYDTYIYCHEEDDTYHELSRRARFMEIYPVIRTKGTGIDGLPAYILSRRPAIQKIGAMTIDIPTHDAILGKKQAFPAVNICSTGPCSIEINGAGATKGHALSRLCQKLGIQPEEVIAIGDNENDITMLQFAGQGVAMGNAPERVKKAANHVTLTNEEDGVAVYLEQALGLAVG